MARPPSRKFRVSGRPEICAGSRGLATARLCLVTSRSQIQQSRLALVIKRRADGSSTHLSLLRNIWGGLHVGSSRPPFGLRELVRWSTARDFFAHPSVMAIPLALLNPFFEELLVRAYLMTEVMELTGSLDTRGCSERLCPVRLSSLLRLEWRNFFGLFFPRLSTVLRAVTPCASGDHRTWALRCLHLDSTLVVPEKQPPKRRSGNSQ